MVTQHIVLDMTPGTKPIVNVSQYDTGARTLVFHLRQNRQTFTPPDGCTGIIHGIKSDSTYFSYSVEIDGDTVVADCTEQMTACVGFAECEVRLSNSEGHVGSANFLLNCEKSPMEGAVISESVIAAAEQLTDRAEQAASSATASATAASASAEAAAESASAASTSEINAAASATAASTSAEEAGESATAAAESASSASGSEASARQYSAAAEQSATDAENLAQGAARDAQTASAKASEAAASADRASDSAVDSANAANLASGYADTARQQAQAAEGSATDAAGSANTASQAAATATTKAGEASASATAANTSAGQAASSASASETSAEQASDSATAAATSAGNASDSATAAAGSASDASDSADSAAASASAAAQSAADIAASAAQIQTNTDNIAALQIVESTSAADITSIKDGADGVPMKSLKVYIEPVQEGSGDPSPDNIRPISGWDSVETVRTGKNFFSGFVKGVRIDDTTGQSSAGANSAASDYIDLPEAFSSATYILSGLTSRLFSVIYFYDASHNYIGRTGGTSRTSATLSTRAIVGSLTGIDPASCKSVRVTQYQNPNVPGTIDEVDTLKTQLELGPTATDYEPYQARTITTDLPSTVYGGVLDVVTGELIINRAMVDLGTLNWISYSTGVNTFRAALTGKAFGDDNLVCENYSTKITPFANMDNCTIRGASGNAYIYIRDNSYGTDATSFKTAMSGVQLVYELATPTTYTLTPEEVKTLLKANNVFANAGKTAIVYVADPKTYIDNSIADAVASLT